MVLHAVSIATFAVPYQIFGLTLFLDLIDRGTHCAFASSATGSAQARDYLLRSLSRYRDGLLFVDCRMNSGRKAKKNTTRLGGVLFGSPCWT